MMIAKNVQRMVAPEQMARLTGWNQRKPVIAIMGEFSAGKSTLLNMLIGQSILPTQVTATKLPPVWLRHGTGAPYRVDRNNHRHPVDLHDLASVPVRDTRYIRIYCEAEVLESCDLLDTPGISDPNIPMGLWIRTIGYANAVLWCTHAGQAWRESERAAWESLPERLRHHSLLLVTRADKIVSDVDRMKIDTRLRRETESLFGGRLFISLTNALRAVHEEGGADLWTSSGAEAFVDMLGSSINAINDRRANALGRYRIDPASAPRVVPRRVRPHASLADAPEVPMAHEDAGADGMAAEETGVAASVVPIRPMRVLPAATNQRERLSAEDSQRLREALIAGEEPAEESIWGDDLADETAVAREIVFDDPEPAAADEDVAWDDGADAMAVGDDLPPAADETAWDTDTADLEMSDAAPQDADASDEDVAGAAFDTYPEAEAPAAEDTIEAVLFGLSDDAAATDAVAARSLPHVAAGGALTASALWAGILAERNVRSVQDLLGAVTDLVTALDSLGFVAGPALTVPAAAEAAAIDPGAALVLAEIETLSFLPGTDEDEDAPSAESDAESMSAEAAFVDSEVEALYAEMDAGEDSDAAEAGFGSEAAEAAGDDAEGTPVLTGFGTAEEVTAEAPESDHPATAVETADCAVDEGVADEAAADVASDEGAVDDTAAEVETALYAVDEDAADQPATEVETGLYAQDEDAADEPAAEFETALYAVDEGAVGEPATEVETALYAVDEGAADAPAAEAPEDAPAAEPVAFVKPAWRRLA